MGMRHEVVTHVCTHRPAATEAPGTGPPRTVPIHSTGAASRPSAGESIRRAAPRLTAASHIRDANQIDPVTRRAIQHPAGTIARGRAARAPGAPGIVRV